MAVPEATLACGRTEAAGPPQACADDRVAGPAGAGVLAGERDLRSPQRAHPAVLARAGVEREPAAADRGDARSDGQLDRRLRRSPDRARGPRPPGRVAGEVEAAVAVHLERHVVSLRLRVGRGALLVGGRERVAGDLLEQGA